MAWCSKNLNLKVAADPDLSNLVEKLVKDLTLDEWPKVFNVMTSQPNYENSRFAQMAENFPSDIDWTRQDPTNPDIVYNEYLGEEGGLPEAAQTRLVELRKKIRRPKK